MNPDNARILRITAAAGTELADAYSHSSPRHRCHGGPLPRRQANVTRANPSPTYLYLPEDASLQNHGALGRISPGYSPETGMLLTRYAPLRRSPPSVLLQTRCPSTCMC